MSGSKWKAEVGMGNSECGMRNAEYGKYKHGAQAQRHGVNSLKEILVLKPYAPCPMLELIAIKI